MEILDKSTAVVLLESLTQRISRDLKVDALSSVSSVELAALQIALSALRNVDEGAPHVGDQRVTPPTTLAATTTVTDAATTVTTTLDNTNPGLKVQVDFNSLDPKDDLDPNILMCLDFGTAMSKAFATVPTGIYSELEYLDLDLGMMGGGKQGSYTLPSSVFINNKGLVFFGKEALDQSRNLADSGRERLDSIKGWLSLGTAGNDLDGEESLLNKSFNPIVDCKLTRGDLIRIYLAYFTDVAEKCLESKLIKIAEKYLASNGEYSEKKYIRFDDVVKSKSVRRVKRRFAHPCWDKQADWAEGQLRKMLAEAQILADTFSEKWSGGLDVFLIKDAIEQIKTRNERPQRLVCEGIREPVAVANDAFIRGPNFRDYFIVVDAGAGTTDFGLFVCTEDKTSDSGKKHVFEVENSVKALMQAGDRVDALLLDYIANKAGVFLNSIEGREIVEPLNREIRVLKEVLFKTGVIEYTLGADIPGIVHLTEFLESEKVKLYSQTIEKGFKSCLQGVDKSWLAVLASEGVVLNVVLTGGSSPLPMIQALGKENIEIRVPSEKESEYDRFIIKRQMVESKPEWMSSSAKDLLPIYPQLAVVCGGVATELPKVMKVERGPWKPSYSN